MPKAAPSAARVRWTAFEPSGLAHAYAGSGLSASRSVCQQATRQDQRFAWPEKSRCPKCLARLGEAV